MAIALAGELEQFRLMYYEDPILPDSVQSCAEVARSTRLPVATGERLHSLIEFRELLGEKTRNGILCTLTGTDLNQIDMLRHGI
jgi:galactonate dehydratase